MPASDFNARHVWFDGMNATRVDFINEPITSPEETPAEPEQEETRYYYCDHCGFKRTGDPALSNMPEQPHYMNARNVCSECVRFYFTCVICSGPEIKHAYPGADMSVCYQCYRSRYFRCGQCDDTKDIGERDVSFSRDTCKSCISKMETCMHCSEKLFPSRGHTIADGVLCRRCAHRSGLIRGDVIYEIIPHGRHDCQTFSVEAEVEFEDGCPWELGDYHSHWEADSYDFYPGWLAEEDGSLACGGEFIGPILSGAGGMAEIISTFNTLKGRGASIRSSCGQHTTVQAPQSDLDTLVKVQKLTAVLEDALFATTGAYQRMRNGAPYVYRLKHEQHDIRDLQHGYNVGTRECVAHIRDMGGAVIEFRYPPGTLSPEQACINIGLCKMVTQLAVQLTNNDVNEWLKLAVALMPTQNDRDTIHQQVLLGLQIIVDLGEWHTHGSMMGLPYNPDEETEVCLKVYGDTRNCIILPTRKQILKRMQQQVVKFYTRMLPTEPYNEEPKVRRDSMLTDVFKMLDVENPVK